MVVAVVVALMMVMRSGGRTTGSSEAAGALIAQPFEHRRQAFSGLKIGENKGKIAAHTSRVAIHHLERGSYVRSEVDLVNHQ